MGPSAPVCPCSRYRSGECRLYISSDSSSQLSAFPFSSDQSASQPHTSPVPHAPLRESQGGLSVSAHPSTTARAALTHTPESRLRRRGSRYRSAQGRGAAPPALYRRGGRHAPHHAPQRPGTTGTVVRRLFQRRTRGGADTQARRVARPAPPRRYAHAEFAPPLGVTSWMWAAGSRARRELPRARARGPGGAHVSPFLFGSARPAACGRLGTFPSSLSFCPVGP